MERMLLATLQYCGHVMCNISPLPLFSMITLPSVPLHSQHRGQEVKKCPYPIEAATEKTKQNKQECNYSDWTLARQHRLKFFIGID